MKKALPLLALTGLLLACQLLTPAAPAPAAAPPPLAWPAVTPSAAAITLDNAGQVEQLARWGNGAVTGLAWSLDGRWLAVATTAGVGVYAGETLAAERFIETDSGVAALVFAPDSARLALGLDDGRLLILRVANWEAEGDFTAHRRTATAVAFAPDGRTLASGSLDGDVVLWDAASFQRLHTLEPHNGDVRRLAFSPDGSRLAVAAARTGGHGEITTGGIKVWDVVTGREQQTLAADRLAMEWAAFSSDGGALLALSPRAAPAEVLTAWDLNVAAPVERFPAFDDPVEAADLSSDGRTLATAHWDGALRLWDAATGREVASWSAHTGPGLYVALAPDNLRLASAGREGQVRLWTVDGAPVATLDGFLPDAPAYGVAFAPDGARLASGWGGRGLVRVVEVATGAELYLLSADAGAVDAVAFSPDGQGLVTAGHQDGVARLWNAADGAALRQFRHGEPVTSVAFAPDGQLLATASWDRTVRLWDPATGAEQRSLAHDRAVKAVAFAPDGRWLASASEDGTAKIWEVTTGRLLQALRHTDWVEAVAFAPDGRTLATASGNAVFLWDVATGASRATLTHPERAGVQSLAFAPNGRLLATGSYDDPFLRLWDPATGRLAAELAGHTESIWSVVFSADGLRLASGAADGTLRLWGIPADR